MMNFSELLTCDNSGIEDATPGTWEILQLKKQRTYEI